MKMLSLLPPLFILCSGLSFGRLQLPFASAHSLQTGSVGHEGSQFNVILHPSTGSCVLRTRLTDPLKLGPCEQSDNWYYTPQKIFLAKGTYFCIQAVESNSPARLSISCTESDSQWNMSLEGESPLSTKLEDGSTLCLDVGADGTIFTKPCLCEGKGSGCHAENQLFEYTNRDDREIIG